MAKEQEIFWTAGFLNERFPAPVSPLGWSVVGPLFEEIALRDSLRYMGYPDADRIPATRLVRGHPYSNVLIFQIIYNPFPEAILPADAVRYFPGGDVSWRNRAPYPRSLFNPRFLLSLLFHLARDPINVSPLNFWQWSRYTRRHDRLVAVCEAKLTEANDTQTILYVLELADKAHRDLLKIHRWSLTYADVFYRLVQYLAGDAAQLLISNVPNLTQRVNDELQELGHLAESKSIHLRELDGDNELADAEFKAALDSFLRRHGHRSFSLDIARPTFKDEPEQFLRLFTPPTPKTPEKQIWKETRAQAFGRLGLARRAFLVIVLKLARRYAALREDQRYYWQKSLAVTRRACLLLGDHLRAQNLLGATDDLFFLTKEEISASVERKESLDLRGLVRSRRAQWQEFEREFMESPTRAYPAFLLGDESYDLELRRDGEEWRGRGVSPGTARGKVRVIFDPRGLGAMEQDEILVAPTTDPGWTPVFSRLSGLILEHGGVLAHGAIVAREYHLPAVAAVPNITRELRDGDYVEVDGTQGIIRRINSRGEFNAA